MICIATLLFKEYLYFCQQSQKLLELQNDYRTYTLAVNRILQDYNKAQEKLDMINMNKNHTKKKRRN